MSAHSDTIATLQKSKIYSTLLSDADRKNVILKMLNDELRKKNRAQAKRIKVLEESNVDVIKANEQKRVVLFKIKEIINEYWAQVRAENSKEAKKCKS